MKKRYKNKVVFLSFLIILGIFSVFFLTVYGYGDFFIINSVDVNNGDSGISTIEPVCYIKQNNTTTYYTSIEKALEVANNYTNQTTVYVIPNTNPEITRQCTIGENVTLCIPYNNNNDVEGTNSDYNTYKDFADNNPDYCMNNITIKKVINDSGNIIPTINILAGGTLITGGIRRNTSPQGATVQDFTQLTLEEDAVISCSGTIESYGFIKESYDNNNSKILIHDGGTIKETIVVYDWVTAGYAQKANDQGIFPFNIFDFPQISPAIYIYKGGKLMADAWLYGGTAGDMTGEAFVIGGVNDIALIKPKFDASSDDYIIFKNTDLSSGTNITKTYANHKLDIDIFGSYYLDSLSLTISARGQTININSANYVLPFSHIFNITLNNGTIFDIEKPIKFLPGSSITISNGAVANLNSECSVYYSNKNSSGDQIRGYSNNTPAKFINNGIIYINSGFSGHIYATEFGNDNTFVYVYNTYQVVNKEIKTYSTSLGGLLYTLTLVDFTSSGTIDIITDDFSNMSTQNIVSNCGYAHISTTLNEYCWKQLNNVKVNFRDFDGNIIYSGEYSYGITISNLDEIYYNYVLYEANLSNNNQFYNIYKKKLLWYVDTNPSNLFDSFVIPFDASISEYDIYCIDSGEKVLAGKYVTIVNDSKATIEIKTTQNILTINNVTYYPLNTNFTVTIKQQTLWGLSVKVSFANGKYYTLESGFSILGGASKSKNYSADSNVTITDN